MRVEPVVTTIGQIEENFEVLRLTKASGTFRVEVKESDRDALLRFALDRGALLWTKEAHTQLNESLKRRNRPRCQKCRRIATSFLTCCCGDYAWCQKHEDTTRLWAHADHDCFPACCAHGHPYPHVTAEELEAILYDALPPADEIFFLENEASANDHVVFHVKVRRKSREERTYEEERLRAFFQVDDARWVERLRTEQDRRFIASLRKK